MKISIYDTNLVNQNLIEEKTNRIESLEEWHKDSSIITKNSDGSPKVFYHGTNANFDTFDINKSANGWLGKGFYFTDKKEATKNFGKKRMLVHLNMKNPYISNSSSPSDLYSEIKDRFYEDKGYLQDIKIEEALKEKGYDGIIYKHWDDSNGIFYVAFESSQIKIVDKEAILKNNKKINNIVTLEEWHKKSNSFSKNKDGTPKVFYHGTKYDFNIFDGDKASGNNKIGNLPSKGTFFFSSDYEKANSYTPRHTYDLYNATPKYLENGNVMPVYLKMEKALTVNAKGDNWNDIYFKDESWSINDLADYAKQKGYDSLIVKNVHDYGEGSFLYNKPKDTVVVFEPTQIKSVFNKGTFDKNNPNIIERSFLTDDVINEINSIDQINILKESYLEKIMSNYEEATSKEKNDTSELKLASADDVDNNSSKKSSVKRAR